MRLEGQRSTLHLTLPKMQKTSRSVVPFIEEETPHVVMTKSHVTPKGGGGTPSPSPFGDPRDPHDPRDPRKGDYKSARAATLHLSQIICCWLELWWCMVIFQNGGPQSARGERWLGGPGQPHECAWIAKHEPGLSRGTDKVGRPPHSANNTQEHGP